MYSLYMTYYIMNKLSILFIAVAVPVGFAAAIAGIVWMVNTVEGRGLDDDHYNNIYARKARRLCYISLVITCLTIFLSTFVPDGKEAMTFAAARFADEYMEKHPKTVLNPIRVVEGVDKGVADVANLIDRFGRIGDKALDILEKKVDTVNAGKTQ